jgi:hypothetical protein
VKRTAIPHVPPLEPGLRELLSAMKENIELLTGVRGANKLSRVPDSAQLADIIAALNEVIDRLS